MSLEVGKIVEGRVEGITNFGAFVNIGEGKTGLVHISEVSETYVKDIRDHLKEGQSVRVKIMSIEENGKMALSIKKAAERPHKTVSSPAEYDWSKKRVAASDSFEDKLMQFKHDSDERMPKTKYGQEQRRQNSRRGNGSRN